MKSIQIPRFLKISACIVMFVGLSASAFASCGDSLAAMMAGGAVVVVQPRSAQPDAQESVATGAKPSIVGLWHIRFMVGGQTIQEAYQVWNAGGTEVHNPNVDPRAGNVCLGAWRHASHGTYKLAHRVWNYDINGNFMGTINLSETLTLSKNGKTHTGIFALDFFDPSGNFLAEVKGDVTGERVSVQ